MRHVFVCHASEDRPAAEQIVGALEGAGITCWIAPRDVGAGEDYAAAIVTALESVDAVVLVMSAPANESPHIRREVERAASLGKTIVPIRLEDLPPSKSLQYFVSDAHWFDAHTGTLESHLPRFVADVGARLVAMGVMPVLTPAGPDVGEQEAVAAAISTLVERYGADLAEDPRRVRALLLDLAGDSPTLVAAAVAAAEIGVGPELATVTPAMQAASRVKLVHRLQRERALTAEMSQWAVDAWADAMTVEIPPEEAAVVVDQPATTAPPPEPVGGPPIEFTPPTAVVSQPAAPPQETAAAPAPTAAVEPPPDRTPPQEAAPPRRRVLLLVVAVVAVVALVAGVLVLSGGCGPDGGAPPLARTTDMVAMAGGGPSNSNDFGDNLAPAGPDLERRWCSEAKTGFGQIAVAGGEVFAEDDDANQMVALDAATGEVLRSFFGQGEAALDENRLYAVGSEAVAFDLVAGTEVWRTGIAGLAFHPPVLEAGSVLVVASGEQETLYVLDADTGGVRWIAEGLDVTSFERVAVSEGTVVVPDGDTIRTFALSSEAPGPTVEADVFDGMVAVGSTALYNGEDGLTALGVGDATRLWASGLPTESPAVAVDEGIAFGLGFEGATISLNAFALDTGDLLWTFRTDLEGSSSRQRPAIASGVAYFAVDSTIFAVDVDTGTLLWSDDVGVNIWSDIVVADGLLIFRGDDDKLHAFG